MTQAASTVETKHRRQASRRSVTYLVPGLLVGIATAATPLAFWPPEVYARIGDAFETVAESVAVDSSRPWLEYYRSEDEVNVLVPVSG